MITEEEASSGKRQGWSATRLVNVKSEQLAPGVGTKRLLLLHYCPCIPFID